MAQPSLQPPLQSTSTVAPMSPPQSSMPPFQSFLLHSDEMFAAAGSRPQLQSQLVPQESMILPYQSFTAAGQSMPPHTSFLAYPSAAELKSLPAGVSRLTTPSQSE